MHCNYHKTRPRLANMSLETGDMTFSSPNAPFFRVSPAWKYAQRRATPTTSTTDYIRVPRDLTFCVSCHERLRNVGICVHWIIQWNWQSINKTDGIKLIHTWRLYGFNIVCVFVTLKYVEIVPPLASSQSVARVDWTVHDSFAMNYFTLYTRGLIKGTTA